MLQFSIMSRSQPEIERQIEGKYGSLSLEALFESVWCSAQFRHACMRQAPGALRSEFRDN